MWVRTSKGIVFFNIKYTRQGISYPTTPMNTNDFKCN